MDMWRNHTLVIILFAMTFMLPVTVIAAALTGYQFVAHNYFIVAGVAAAVYAAFSIILLRSAEKQYSKAVIILIAFLPLLSEINLLFYMWESGSIFVTLLSAVWIVISIILVCKISKSRVLKVASAVISLLLLISIGFIAFAYFTFGRIGQDVVVDTVVSPKETHYAEVIASSQGALGGNTVVQVYHEHDRVNLFVCEFQKVQRVYIGEWGAHNDMEINWESEQELTINGNTCMIE